jgi:beta-N-acetylhexosaminidase
MTGSLPKALPLGELFVVGFDGLTVPADARALFASHGAGGAILFKRNIDSVEQVVELNTSLFALGKNRSPLIVSVDQEGGRVARLRGLATDVPSMRAVGHAVANGDTELPYRLGAMMARELSSLGFHWDFAPVVDVDTNPNNPVIGERSFSRDAKDVGLIAARFIAGMQGAGVASCAKHFPGHGDTDTDSHHALPVLSHDLQRLRDVELVPFRHAIDADVASVMTAHVLFPALDAAQPATLSPVVLHNLLRKQLGYDGVIVSDDLEMKAVADRAPVEELVRLGLLAGVDLFLICKDTDKAARAIDAAHHLVDRGEVPRSVEQALRRVAAMKNRFVGAPAAPSLADAKLLLRAQPHTDLVARIDRIVDSVRASSPVDVT